MVVHIAHIHTPCQHIASRILRHADSLLGFVPLNSAPQGRRV